MKKTTLLLLGIVMFCAAQAQRKISGVYKPQTKSYETKDTTYWIGLFDQGVAQISRQGYMGLMDSTGRVLCKPKYDKILDFNGSIAIVCLNHKYGLINSQGKELISPTMYFIDDFYSGLAWFKASINGLWGLMNKEGQIIIEPRFSWVYRFKDGFAYCMTSNGASVIISETGEVIYEKKKSIAAQGDKIYKERLWVKMDAVLERRKRDLSFEKDIWQNSRKTPFHFFDGLALIPLKVDSKILYGYINQQGKKRVDFIYEDAHNFVKHTACVKKNGKWGVINKRGKVIIPFKYETLLNTKAGFFIFSEKEWYGIISDKGEVVIPPKYLGAKHLWGSIFGFWKYSDKAHKIIKSGYHKSSNVYPGFSNWGVIDIRSNNTILPFKYDHIKIITEHFGIGIHYRFEIVKGNSLNQVLQSIQIEQSMPPMRDFKMTVLSTPFNHEQSQDQFKSSPFYFLGYGVSNSTLIKYPIYKEIENTFFDFHEAILDQRGVTIKDSLGVDFVKRQRYRNGLLKMVDITTHKQGVRAYDSRIILPSIYEEINVVTAGIIVQKDSLYGYYDLQGNEVLPIVYQRMEETVKGTLKVVFQDSVFIIDKRGNRIKR